MKSSTGFAFLGLTIVMVLFGRNAFGAAGEEGVPVGADKAAIKAPVTGTACKSVKFDFVASDVAPVSTTSSTFVDMPDMSVDFKVAGNNRCLKVEFSAYTFAATGALMNVRAVLDGTTVGAPGEVQFDGDSDENGDGKWARSHAFNFAFVGVSTGVHNVKIQWRSFFGDTIFAHKRSLFVHHQ